MVADLALVVALVSAAAAVYAAIQSRRANETATCALEWQQERDRPSVRIEFQHDNRAHAVVINPNNPKPAAKYYELSVRVVNYGATAEQLVGLTIEKADHHQRVDLMKKVREEPTLEPHTAFPVGVNVGNIPDRGEGYIAIARLARGAEIVSDVEHLQLDLLKAIAQHNENAGYGRPNWSKFGRVD